jgi:iron complex outermembrane receptor protein
MTFRARIRLGAAVSGVAVVLVIVSISPVGAQTAVGNGSIRGSVVEQETARPLPAAQVRVLEVHREEPAHQDGTFLFRDLAPGTYTVVAEHLGYARATDTVRVSADSVSDVRLALRVAAIDVGELVVTGAITRREGRDVLGAISAVTGAELDRKLDVTVGATLQGQPGLAVGSLGPATGRPVIRGLGGDRILMLEDGQRTGDLSSLSADHAVAIEAVTARQIEVVRGPMSLLYGSSALGGVVNVIRDEIPGALPTDAHGSAILQANSVSAGLAGGAQVTFGTGSFAFRAEASGRTSGDVATPAGDLVNTDATTLGGSLGAAWVGERGHAGVAYRFYDNQYGIPGGFVGGHAQGVDIDMRRHSFRSQVELHRSGWLSGISANAGVTDYHHAERGLSGSVSTRFGQTLAHTEVVARHGTSQSAGSGAVGVRAQYRDITTGGTLRTPSTRDVGLAAFVVEERALGPVRLQAGLRYDWAHYAPQDTSAYIAVGGEFVRVRARDFGSISASLGALYVVSDAVRLGLNLSRAYRTPDFNELYSNGPHLAANTYEVGDTELSPETGLGADIFVRVSHARGSLEVAAFHNTLSDYIFPSSRGRAELGLQGGRPRFQYTNEDARFVGLEADGDLSLMPKLVADGTVSWVRATFTSDRAPIPIIEDADTTFVPASQAPPLIPPLNGQVGLRWEDPRWMAGAGVRWATAQRRLGDFETVTDGYVIPHAHAGFRIARGGRLHTLIVRVDNPFDTEYRNHLSRIKEIMPQPGRDISLVYRLSF